MKIDSPGWLFGFVGWWCSSDVAVFEAARVAIKGKSYRLKDTKLTLSSEKTENKVHYAINNVARNAVVESGPFFSDR